MLAELKSKIIAITSLVDEVFDKNKINTYHLVLNISVDGIKLAVKDAPKNRFIAFESYKLENVYGLESVLESFVLLAKSSKLMEGRYKNVSCFVVNNCSTIVPAPLYDESRRIQYLQMNVSVGENEIVLTDDIKNMDAKNIFALPADLQSLLYSLFPNVQLHHFSSALISSLLTVNKNQTVKRLYVHVQSNQFETLVIEGKKLLFYNTFNYHTAEDFIYYLLFVCEQLQLNPETIEAILLGDIEKSSDLFSIAYKYIRTVKIGERNDGNDYSYQLQTMPKHGHLTLFTNYAD